MGLASVIRGCLFGRPATVKPPAPPPHPWTLQLVGAKGQADCFVGEKLAVEIPVSEAGSVEAVALYYGVAFAFRFHLDRVYHVTGGDVIRFDLLDLLRASEKLARLGATVQSAVTEFAAK